MSKHLSLFMSASMEHTYTQRRCTHLTVDSVTPFRAQERPAKEINIGLQRKKIIESDHHPPSVCFITILGRSCLPTLSCIARIWERY